VVDERLDVCAACGEQFVIPERLMGLHDDRLVVGLRCAACGVRKLAVVRAGLFEDMLSRYDVTYPDVERGFQPVEIERFAAALAVDAILPEDF
jgi:DNA-directed RNA polymerase subunit RPC12/RpoP